MEFLRILFPKLLMKDNRICKEKRLEALGEGVVFPNLGEAAE